jgi:hypothetical protein
VSADTIVPGYTNPQNLNRYSYVANNPLRYTDPTGHMMDDGGGIGGGGCGLVTPCGGGGGNSGNGGGGGNYCATHPNACGGSGGGGDSGGGSSCDTNGNGVADIPCPDLTTRDIDDGFDRLGSPDVCPVTSLIECYYLHASLEMGQSPMNIDLEDFRALLLAIYLEVNGRNSADLIVTSMGFDTPFYDHGALGGYGALPGSACISGLGCYDRHELNYVAQGEISAAAGESTFARV